MILLVALGLILWIVAGIWYIIANLGNKNAPVSKTKYIFEYIVCTPALGVAYIVGFINKLLGSN